MFVKALLCRPGWRDQVIREDPSAAWKRCRGTEKSAEDLVGPPEWMELERRSTAVNYGCAMIVL